MKGFANGGFPTVQPLVHGENDITLVGSLKDKHCAVGVIREEDLMIVTKEIEDRINASFQRILDGMKESGAV